MASSFIKGAQLLSDIHDKNINFLIGAGASVGFLPVLQLKVRHNGVSQSIETLADLFREREKEEALTLLFMHYYKACIEPAMLYSTYSSRNKSQRKVIENYEAFLYTLLEILLRKSNSSKRCNIFTTNYDGCFCFAAENLLQSSRINFIMNDGSQGFMKRTLHTRNFDYRTIHTGVFARHEEELPQINLIHLHGSVYWYANDDRIDIDYSVESNSKRAINNFPPTLESFSKSLNSSRTNVEKLGGHVSENLRKDFWERYNSLPIVNPSNWKFHETVFNEYYYEMLRHLSYELEKPNSIVIVFGFSFGDNHIRNLIKRSLSNPSLLIYICCYNRTSARAYKKLFGEFNNVKYISPKETIDFTFFNKKIFTLKAKRKGRK